MDKTSCSLSLFFFVLICNGHLMFDSKYNKNHGDLFPRNESVFFMFLMEKFGLIEKTCILMSRAVEL